MENTLATIYIVDDDPQVCRAIGRLLDASGYRTRTYVSATAFLADHDSEVPGCVVLDIAMPELDGLEVQALLNSSDSKRPIIFLTANASIPITVTAVRAGAVNFLTKPVSEVLLFAAVEEALKIDSAERSSRRARFVLAARLGSLTPRERQVLEQVVSGRLNKQIAGDLGIGEKTIKVHRGRVMHKMGARTVAELVRLADTVGVPVHISGGSVLELTRSALCAGR